MKDFIKSHTSLTVIIIAALLIELTTGFIYYNSQDIIKRTTVRVMECVNDVLKHCIETRQSPKDILDTMTNEVHRFVKDAPQSDDLTMLIIRYDAYLGR